MLSGLRSLPISGCFTFVYYFVVSLLPLLAAQLLAAQQDADVCMCVFGCDTPVFVRLNLAQRLLPLAQHLAHTTPLKPVLALQIN